MAIELNIPIQKVKIFTVSPASTAHGVAVTVTLTGLYFNPNGYMVISSVQMPVNASTSYTKAVTCTFLLDTTIVAGTYDVEYYDLAGNYAVLTGGIILT